MANEVTIPLLPRSSIDEMVAFYEVLGFRRTYRQTKPNPYAVVRREDWELHFFGIDGFDPETSYGTCVVQVPDIGVVHAAFAEGLRARYGKVPAQGIPRMTRPRRRKNVDEVSGFSVVDPGGNWIRIFPAGKPTEDAEPASKLRVALDNAVVQGDSRGDHTQAAKILDGALTRSTDAPAVGRVEALAYRVEIARRTGDTTRAEAALADLHAVPLTDTERAQVAETLNALEDLTCPRKCCRARRTHRHALGCRTCRQLASPRMSQLAPRPPFLSVPCRNVKTGGPRRTRVPFARVRRVNSSPVTFPESQTVGGFR